MKRSEFTRTKCHGDEIGNLFVNWATFASLPNAISIFKEIWNFLNQRHYGILKYLNLTKLKILPKYQFYKIGHSDVSHCCFLLQKCDLRTKLTRSETHTFYCRLVNELSYSPNGIGQYLP